ncbi:unnamed protein product [Cuscuta campestris]|uniref:Uncharacterized protein n=1 Tax=Cuscuta campestris TaxID=132261 RepID=A0A484LJP6_9ASTE|nr:unnamed protein product [Cuscuta campestris]
MPSMACGSSSARWGPSPAESAQRPLLIQEPHLQGGTIPVTHYQLFQPLFPPPPSINLPNSRTNRLPPLHRVLYSRSQLAPRRSAHHAPGTSYHPYVLSGQSAMPRPRHPVPPPPRHLAPLPPRHRAPHGGQAPPSPPPST